MVGRTGDASPVSPTVVTPLVGPYFKLSKSLAVRRGGKTHQPRNGSVVTSARWSVLLTSTDVALHRMLLLLLLCLG